MPIQEWLQCIMTLRIGLQYEDLPAIVLLCMCPHTKLESLGLTNCRRQYCEGARAVDEKLDRFTSGTTATCVLILLLYMCPHTTAIYVSSYY
jgi:hypothetical protein